MEHLKIPMELLHELRQKIPMELLHELRQTIELLH
jgi:hypothetical protein